MALTERTIFDDDGEGMQAAEFMPTDPAYAAAQIMVELAVARHPEVAVAMNSRSVVVIVRTPLQDWSDLISSSLMERAYQESSFGNHIEGLDKDTSLPITIVAEKSRRRRLPKSDVEALADAMWRGKVALCVSADPKKDFPTEFVDHADHEIVIPWLTKEDLFAFAGRFCEAAPNGHAFTGQPELVTPTALRLAFRPGKTGDFCLQRLSQICTSRTRVVTTSSVREAPDLTRLHGMVKAREWGLKLAADIAAYKAGKISWSAVDNGLLLSGPPGVGKSLFARALATSCEVPLIATSYSAWQSEGDAHMGTTLKAMRKAFADAKAVVPSILFIDETDSFPNRAVVTRHADYTVAIVNALLSEIDGAESRAGVVILGACNHPHLLDPALLRSGRLDRHIRIDLPSARDLQDILREHLNDDLADDDLSKPAFFAVGSSGADCERFVRGARRRARVTSRPMVVADLIDEIVGQDDLSETALQLAAIHESGHAYAISVLLPGHLEAVSLRSDGDSGGAVSTNKTHSTISSNMVKRLLCSFLGGRAAEHILLRMPSSGAGGDHDSDLAKATRLALHSVTALGFSETMGLTWLGQPEAAAMAATLSANPKLATTVSALLDDAYEATLAIIRDGRTAVMELAGMLAKQRVLSAVEVEQIIERAGGKPDHDWLLALLGAQTDGGRHGADQ
jgi:hypothetical protein